ncbi:MAG: hypothetical protein JSV81_02595 [Anaerolineales bacterium]|nr:MAG: hypothetical protein JSV81_02595 [Anaerolineales bacterium]
MAITTYAELKSAVADWLNRDDLDAAIPNFISLAEAQFNRTMRHRKMVTRSDATLDTPYFAVPADWLENIRFQLNTNPIVPLLYVTPEQAAEERQKYSASGQPLFFSMVGQQFQVVPSPDTSYSAELLYYAKIPALSDGNTTNWLLSESPDVYLYGALVQSAPYLKEDERISVWAGLYQRFFDDMMLADERARIGSSKLKARFRTFG